MNTNNWATSSAYSQKAIIQQIHNDFDYSTSDLIKKSEIYIEDKYIRRASNLKELGFTSAEPVQACEKYLKDVEAGQEAKKLSDYYAQKYPNQKFITKAQVELLNEKYGLICAPISWYKGDVPEVNVMELLAFKGIKKGDEVYRIITSFGFIFGFSDKDTFKVPEKQEIRSIEKEGLQICAPESMMEVPRNYFINSKGFAVQDPIVLAPVKGGFLIITKWGLEASDPSLTNEKMN